MKKLILLTITLLIISCSTEKIVGNEESKGKFEGTWLKVAEYNNYDGVLYYWRNCSHYELLKFNDNYVEYDCRSGSFQKGNFTIKNDSLIIDGNFYWQSIGEPKNPIITSSIYKIPNYYELKQDTLMLERLYTGKSEVRNKETGEWELDIIGMFKEKFVKLYDK